MTGFVSLDGKWSFTFSDKLPSCPPVSISEFQNLDFPIYSCNVPGNFELDLQKVGTIEEPFHGMNIASLRQFERSHVWYFRQFEAQSQPGSVAELHFEGIDCFVDIYLNGKKIGSADNMLIEHSFPIDAFLTSGSRTYELVVHIRPTLEEARKYEYPPGLGAPPNSYDSLYVRKAPHMFGWDIMPRALSAGLWRSISLRYESNERLDYVYLRTLSIAKDGRIAQVALHFQAFVGDLLTDDYEVALKARCGSSVADIRQRLIFGAGRVNFAIPDPILWWPRGRGDAALYDVEVRLFKNKAQIDHKTLKFGVRTVDLDRTGVTDSRGTGEFCFRINGEKTFIKGTNWVPLDAYHSRDRERLDRAIALVEEINCNLLRCWGGNVYESNEFFDLCDATGIMVWQDFALACAVYPQDVLFQERLAVEVRQVVRRLRNHCCLILWAGDNECDQAYGWHSLRNPNANVLTRQVIPDILRAEDPSRPYLPSSPYIDEVAYEAEDAPVPEDHLWGPRDYYKSNYYKNSICHFASEIGYHGCPSPESIQRFISEDKLWPAIGNVEWILHSTSPVPGMDIFSGRVELMFNQITELFGVTLTNLEDFSFASQASQAEAKKFFVELFRAGKWRRTGIIWWNLLDGWPQFSDAVVDYYFVKKLAFDFIKRSQESICLVMREPTAWKSELVVCNDTRESVPIEYWVTDIDTGETAAWGEGIAMADAVTKLAEIPFSMSKQKFYVLEWRAANEGNGKSHYLSGTPPFDLDIYRGWLEAAGFID